MTGAHRALETPLGPLVLSADASGRLTGVSFGPTSNAPGSSGAGGVLDDAAAQLGEYFDGRRRAFTLPLAIGGTSFQRQVWEQLRRVRYGTTVSYAELARRVGRAGAARAVGHANARNPLAIIVPCHRVVGASGGLTGYGGGLEAKRFLLGIEAGAASRHPG